MAVLMVVTILPVQVFAATKPTSIEQKLFLALYLGDEFPAEPGTGVDGDYVNFTNQFTKTYIGWLGNSGQYENDA